MSYNYEFNHWDFYNLEKIGNGSFGAVYRARQNYDEDVAIKIVRTSREARLEASRLGMLYHPNVVRFLGMSRSVDCENEDPYDPDLLYHVPWIVMEFVDGWNLLDFMFQEWPGGVPGHGLVQMALGIARGMKHIHSRGIVHRDLAARNILVVRNSNWGNVKIADFGISQEYQFGQHYQQVSGRILPVRWMPPENISVGGHFSKKGDVWSFGVVLFEMWTRGSLPYAPLPANQICAKIQQGNNPLDYKDVKARRWILDLMLWCWEFDQNHRPNFKQIVSTIEQEG